MSAAAENVDGLWFNPAVNAKLTTWQVVTSHALLYPGLNDAPTLHSTGVNYPVPSGPLMGWTWQVAMSFLNARHWEEQIALLGCSRQVHPRLATGVALQTNAWKTVGLSHRVWDLNLGGLYEVGWIHPEVYLRLSGVVGNLHRANLSSSGKKAGLSDRVLTLGANIEVQETFIYLDWGYSSGRGEMRVGMDSGVGPTGGLRLRLGAVALSSPREGKEIDVGLGHQYGPWRYDYSFTYPVEVTGLGGIHRFSLVYEAK